MNIFNILKQKTFSDHLMLIVTLIIFFFLEFVFVFLLSVHKCYFESFLVVGQ